MSEASAERAVNQGPIWRPPRKYSLVEELARLEYTKPMVRTTTK